MYFKIQDDRPIKFEKYNNQELRKMIAARYKVGDFIGTAVEELAFSKIDRMIFIEVTATVKYEAPLFSLSPLAHYAAYF